VSVLLAAGIAYRVINSWYFPVRPSIALPPHALEELPMTLGMWHGRDVSMDPRIVSAADAEAYLSREYVNAKTGEVARVWVAYGAPSRDFAPHRPDVCYPGAGWNLLDVKPVELKPASGLRREIKAYSFRKSGIDSSAISVLHWYLMDGVHAPDDKLLREKVLQDYSKPGYALQAQVNSDLDDASMDPGPGQLEFAANLVTALEQLMMQLIPPNGPSGEIAAAAPGQEPGTP
jgi:hypothetical protein